MAERDVAAEVLQGLREMPEHRSGKRTLRATRVDAKPLPGLTPAHTDNGESVTEVVSTAGSGESTPAS